MPGFLLNVESEVLCTHGGKAEPLTALFRVEVMGAPAVGQTSTYVVSGCPFTTPAGAPSPCVTASNWVAAAVRVKAMNVPVLLATSKAVCSPNGVPTIVVPVEARVKGT